MTVLARLTFLNEQPLQSGLGARALLGLVSCSSQLVLRMCKCCMQCMSNCCCCQLAGAHSILANSGLFDLLCPLSCMQCMYKLISEMVGVGLLEL